MTANARRLEFAWRVVAAAGLVLLAALSLTPDPIALSDAPHVDKLQHLAAYAVLTWWLAQLEDAQLTRRRAAATLMLLGVLLELAQLGIATRELSFGDILANGAGVAIGTAVAPPRTRNVLAWLRTRVGDT
jgi:VanZ family protein